MTMRFVSSATNVAERLEEIKSLLPKLNFNTDLIEELLDACSSQQERIKVLEEELIGVKKDRNDLHNDAEDAMLKLSSILTQLGHEGRSDDMFIDSMLLIRKLQERIKEMREAIPLAFEAGKKSWVWYGEYEMPRKVGYTYDDWVTTSKRIQEALKQ